MTFKRRVLSAFGKVELLAIGRKLDLDVTTRMSVDELCDVLAGSKRATLAAIVDESLPRDTLKAISAACGLNEEGKEKRLLVERILVGGENGAGTYKLDARATRVLA